MSTFPLRCATRAEFQVWRDGDHRVKETGHDIMRTFCVESDRAWCAEMQAEGRCVRTDREYRAIVTLRRSIERRQRRYWP